MRGEGRVAPPARLAEESFAITRIMRTEQAVCQRFFIVTPAKLQCGGRVRAVAPCHGTRPERDNLPHLPPVAQGFVAPCATTRSTSGRRSRSEEHTSELQSPYDLVCRLLLE